MSNERFFEKIKEVPRQMGRNGMDIMELAVGQVGAEKVLSLGLTVKNFLPESSGAWGKRDVLSFHVQDEGPVYLNLSLLRGLLKPVVMEFFGKD